MTSLWDVVINCDLREDTPESVIRAISFLAGDDVHLEEKPQMYLERLDINIWDSFPEPERFRFLSTDPEREVFSSFQRRYRSRYLRENNREIYRYSLVYSCKALRDGDYYDTIAPFIEWLPSYAVEGLLGYYKLSDLLFPGVQLFAPKDVCLWYAIDGKLIEKWIRFDE